MSHKKQLAVLLLVLVFLSLAILWPPSTKCDQPVVASRIPASEFERVSLPFPHPEGLTDDEDYRGHLADASRSVRARRIAPGSPMPIVPLPSPSAPRPVSVAPAARTCPASMTGIASWYRYVVGGAAAGPRLRAALGPGWRGRSVTVCAAICVQVRLSDWMAADRLVDLDSRSFSRLAPLSRGIVEVSVRW